MSAKITNHEIEKHQINHTAPLLKAGQKGILASKTKTRKLMAIPLLMAIVLAVLLISERWGGINVLSEPIGGNANYYLYAAIVLAVIAFFIFLFGSAEGKANTLYDDIVNSWGELLSWEVLDPGTLRIAINTNSVELSANEVLKDNADKLIQEHLQRIDQLMNEIANIYD